MLKISIKIEPLIGNFTDLFVVVDSVVRIDTEGGTGSIEISKELPSTIIYGATANDGAKFKITIKYKAGTPEKEHSWSKEREFEPAFRSATVRCTESGVEELQ